MVLHVHDEIMLKVLYKITGSTVNNIIKYNAFIGRNVWVIDVFRTPIERKISHFFEELSSVHFNNSELNLNTYPVDKIIARFNRVFPYVGVGDHFLDKYGLNRTEIPEFDFVRKMMLVEKNGVKYLKLRLKDSPSWGAILSGLLKTEIIVLPDHETGKKALGGLYAKFKAQYKIPENLLNTVVEDISLFTFYSKEEREDYIGKWRTTVTPPFASFTQNEYNMYHEISSENSLYMKVKYDHYLDNGCVCMDCSKRRVTTKRSIKNGAPPSRLVHMSSSSKSNVKNMKTMKCL
jgi:hypothetical protein